MKKIIIALAVLLMLGEIGILYAKNGGQLKGMFMAGETKTGIREPVSIKAPDGTSDMPITKGRFIAMIAKAVMTTEDSKQVKNLRNCLSKNYKYAGYLNYACKKGWTRGENIGSPITRQEAATILAQAFGIHPENYTVFTDITGSSPVNTLGAVGIFEEIQNNGKPRKFSGEELLGEKIGKNWVKRLRGMKSPES